VDLLRHLRHFVVVAEELHFGRAAEVLGIAQPPLSQSIRRLERELGVELFDRSRRRVALAPAGRLLLDGARDLLSGEERMRALMRMVGEGELGALRVGVPPETPAATIHALVDGLAVQLPGLEVELREASPDEQVRMLAGARLDVGLVHHPLDAPDLRFGPAVTVVLGVVVSRASPLARRTELDLADLADHDLVLPPRATAPGWHDHVLEVCRRHGFAPARIRSTANPEFRMGLLLSGNGVALEPETTARREPRVVWRPLAGEPLRRSTSAAWPVRSPHPAAERFGAVVAATWGEPGPGPVAVPHADAARPWSVVFAAATTGG
jgi:DNA-binding transcriptional LysR family regulator